MAAKKKDENARKPIAEVRAENEKLHELLEDGVRCIICDTLKRKDKFYSNTDPMCKSDVGCVCRDCARKIALQVDEDGNEYEPTKESVQLALSYLNKPFLNKIWDSSIAESENVNAGNKRSNAWMAYVKNIAMEQ